MYSDHNWLRRARQDGQAQQTIQVCIREGDCDVRVFQGISCDTLRALSSLTRNRNSITTLQSAYTRLQPIEVMHARS